MVGCPAGGYRLGEVRREGGDPSEKDLDYSVLRFAIDVLSFLPFITDAVPTRAHTNLRRISPLIFLFFKARVDGGKNDQWE